ncbi:MAG TPA: LysR family transcriptional regulator [Caulobacteraceae bacterium]|nr:LysR family transcriptional regulator [Caulobacteraceae bacterium]
MLDLGSLQIFVRASELGSFSKVADQMHLALAAVSRRMAQLEYYYGVTLFVRTGRGVELTPAGQALLDHAKAILGQVNNTRLDIADFANGLRGSVRLHVCTSAISQFLPKDLASFHDEFPDIRLDIREALSLDIVTAIRDGAADVGVIVAGPHPISLPTANYRRDRLAVVAPLGFAPGVASVRLADIVQHELVILEDNTATTRMISAVALDQGLTVRLRVKVGSFDAVCRMVEAGFGIGILPRAAAAKFGDTLGLQLIDLEDAWAERQMLLVTSSGPPYANLAIRQLVTHLIQAGAAEAHH